MGSENEGTPIRARALEQILGITRALARPMDLNVMLELVIDAARVVLGADRGTVFLYDQASDELFARVATGEREIRVPASAGIVGECARTRSVINVQDCYADERFNADVDRKTGYRTRCLMAVPLIGNDESLEGVLQVLNKAGGVFDAEDELIATALGAQCAVALQRTRLLEDRLAKEKMQRELLVARRIQMRVLPQVMPTVEGYRVAGWCRPADEAGGDIFDLQQLEGGRLAILLADATGHGIGPALSVTQCRSMLRMCFRFDVGLDEAAQHVNDQLSEDLSSNRFVTAFLGRLDPVRHELDYIAAAQGPLLAYRRAENRAEWLTSSTRPLGILGGLPMGGRCSLVLDPGDMLLLATDGVFEYEDPAGEQFGKERLFEVVRRLGETEPEAVIEAVVKEIETFARGAGQADDMTLVVLQRDGAR